MGACLDPLMILTEYVPRGDLCALLASSEQLSLPLRVKMATDAATGMSWLHEMRPERVLHRDLKSKNLLVDNQYRVKVADFGLSQLLPDGMAGQDSNAMRGTPLWNAPEVLQRQVFTEKADIYSFAICLWELVTRQAPFVRIFSHTLTHTIAVFCAIDRLHFLTLVFPSHSTRTALPLSNNWCMWCVSARSGRACLPTRPTNWRNCSSAAGTPIRRSGRRFATSCSRSSS